MKMNTKIALVFAAAALTAATAVSAPKSADTLHFAIRSDLTDQGVEPGASGAISANEVRTQGTVKLQKLDVTVKGLTANTGYSLTATTGGGTTDLEDFTTDNNGGAMLHLRSGKVGKNMTALPDGFELAAVTELDVENGGSTSVLSTTGSTPTSVTYSVKRTLTGNNGESGLLLINANTKHTKFSLDAAGLQPGADYQLVFNGTPVQTNTADSKGRLKIKSAPTPDNILDLGSVELWDASNTAVLSTTLP